MEVAGDGTRVKYVVSAQVGGKLAQIGGRLIEGTARNVAREFFDKFSDLVTAGVTGAAIAESAAATALPVAKEERLPGAVPLAVIGVISIAILLVAIFWK